jgi:hypothetical protein
LAANSLFLRNSSFLQVCFKFWKEVSYLVLFFSEPGNQQAFDRAKKNLLDNYLIVGTIDRMEQMIQLLEFLIPEYFRNAFKHFRSLDGKLFYLKKKLFFFIIFNNISLKKFTKI